MTLVLLLVAGVVAVADWVAVDRRARRAELVLKPLALALLVATAATSSLPPAVQPWVVAALALGLLGDVGLMLTKDVPGPPDLLFLLGLAAFLLGHLAYVVAFLHVGQRLPFVIAGFLVVGGVATLALPRVLVGARSMGGATLAAAVALYAMLLATMAVTAVGTSIVATALGGVLFLVSDVILARGRFVAPVPQGSVLVIVTYHLGQALLLIGLLAAT